MPKLVVMAGPNGAGKSTCASQVLRGAYGVEVYVNADVIAQGLSGFSAENAAFEAGAIMLTRLHALAKSNADFAFETTLASRSLAPWIREIVVGGYEFHLAYLWLPSADLAVRRVHERVARGGHSVPESTIRRRYSAGILNFFELYQPLASSWQVYDTSGNKPRLVAAGAGANVQRIKIAGTWKKFERIGHQ